MANRWKFKGSAVWRRCVLLSLVWACGCGQAVTPMPRAPAARVAAAAAAPDDVATAPFDWKKEVADVLAPAPGMRATLNEKEQVYAVVVPRADLDVKIDGMPVPVAAGLESRFYFYRCSCGKMSVLGEFLVIDYEANDVVDALRAGNQMRVTGVGGIAIGDRPRLMSVRFHGEGEATPLAKVIREALRWTGEERMKPRKD